MAQVGLTAQSVEANQVVHKGDSLTVTLILKRNKLPFFFIVYNGEIYVISTND